jgi:hypothetical protein
MLAAWNNSDSSWNKRNTDQHKRSRTNKNYRAKPCGRCLQCAGKDSPYYFASQSTAKTDYGEN